MNDDMTSSTENFPQQKLRSDDELLLENRELGEKVKKLSEPITLRKEKDPDPLHIPTRAESSTLFADSSARTLPTAVLEDTQPQRSIRFGTVVWGAIIMAVGIILITARQANLTLDPALTAMWLLLGAGVVMVAGGAVHVLRRK